MKTELKKLDQHKRKLSVEVEPEVVNKRFEGIYERISKDAEVPGFRRGKAPRDILERHYRDLAHQEVIKELVPEAYNEAIKKEALDVLNCIEIGDVKLDNNSLSFTATLELKPCIDFKKGYKNIRINYKNIIVSEEEIKRRLDSLKTSRKIDNLDQGFARSLGYPDLEQLQDAMRRQIYLEKESDQRLKVEEAIIKYLLEISDFQVPGSLVQQQLKELVERQKIELALRGVPKEKVEQQEKNLSENLKPQADRRVKVYLILEAIAKKENIPLDKDIPQKVIEFLLRNADWDIKKEG